MLTIYLWKPGKRLLRLDTINQYTIRDWWIQENKRAKWFSLKIKNIQTLVRQFSEGPCREGWAQWKRERRQQKEGKTSKNVQIVSGQFKGYCREGWALWTGKKTKIQNEEIVQVVSGQFSKGYCREGGHTGRGSCRFLPVSLFTHLGCFYTYHQTYDCKSIFKKSSISLWRRP